VLSKEFNSLDICLEPPRKICGKFSFAICLAYAVFEGRIATNATCGHATMKCEGLVELQFSVTSLLG
jgi:hypothetical protein